MAAKYRLCASACFPETCSLYKQIPTIYEEYLVIRPAAASESIPAQNSSGI